MKDLPGRRVGKNVFFDGMAWPLPDGDLEWRLRYATPSKEDLLHAASILSAYATIITAPQRIRNDRASVVKRHYGEIESRPSPSRPAGGDTHG